MRLMNVSVVVKRYNEIRAAIYSNRSKCGNSTDYGYEDQQFMPIEDIRAEDKGIRLDELVP